MQSSFVLAMIAGAWVGFAFSHGQALGEEGATDVSLLQYTLDIQEQDTSLDGQRGEVSHSQPIGAATEAVCEPTCAAGQVCTTTGCQAIEIPEGYTHVGSHGMCTDNELTNWNEGIEVGRHSRSRQDNIHLCANRCDATAGCNGFVYWHEGEGGSCDNCCRTYGACDTMRNNGFHEYVGSDAYLRAIEVPSGYTHVGRHGMCTDNELTNWNEGIEVGQHSRSRQDSMQLCADRCDATAGCNGFVYWQGGAGGSCDNCCRTYGACNMMRNNGHHEYNYSDAYLKAIAVPSGYTHVGSHAMCTDNELTNWNEGIEVGRHSRSRQDNIDLCAQRCDTTAGCNGFVYWQPGTGGSCDNCCRTYGACDTTRNNGHHEYVGSDAYLRAIAVPSGYTHVGDHGMCTDNELTNWNEGIEVGRWSRSRQDDIHSCAERCDSTAGCNGFVYWPEGLGGSCDNCCRTYGACDTMRNTGFHEYVGSHAYLRAIEVPSGYTHVGRHGMCTDNELTNWNEGIEVGQHSRSRQENMQLCADRCDSTAGCNGFVFWGDDRGSCDNCCRTYGACNMMRNNEHHEYMYSDAYLKAIAVPSGYTHVGSHGMCTDNALTNWNEGIEVGQHSRSKQENIDLCAERCDSTEGCSGFVYWQEGEGGSCDNCCRTYGACDTTRNNGHHEYVGSNAYSKAQQYVANTPAPAPALPKAPAEEAPAPNPRAKAAPAQA